MIQYMINKYKFFNQRKTFAFFLFCFICINSNIRAYANKTDSLQVILKEHAFDDSTRVNLFITLSEIYQDNNLDSSIYFASIALSIAEKINFEKGKANSLMQLGLAYLRKSDYNKAIPKFTEALNIFEKSGNIHRQANALLDIADVYYSLGKIAKAIEYYNKGNDLFDKLNYPTGKGFALLSIGGIYNDSGNYAEATNYFLKALSAFEKDNYSQGIRMALTNVATIYSQLGDFAKASEYVNKCLLTDESKSTKEQNLYVDNNIAMVYSAMKEYNKAKTLFEKSAGLADEIGDGGWKNLCIAYIADMNFGLKNYDTAYAGYTKSLQYAENIKDPKVSCIDMIGMGKISVLKGNLREGIKQLTTAYEISQKNQLRQTLFESAKELSNAYEKNKDMPHAYQFLKISYDYRDSLNNESKEKKIQQLQYEYDLNKKENEIKLLEKDKLLQKTINGKQKIVSRALIAGLIGLAIFCFMLVRSIRYEKQSRKKIMKQKEEIELQAAKLEDLNHFKDKTFSVLSHDLRGPVSAFTSLIMLLDQNVITINEFSVLKPEINKQLISLNILLDNLLNWARNYMHGAIAAKPANINLHEIASRNINLIQDQANKKQIIIYNKIPDDLGAFADESQMDIVIRNLLMNAVKFTRQNGKITLDSSSNNENVEISITDNGVGMTKEQLGKLFEIAPGNNTYGTEGETGTGLGLLLCNEFVKTNNGKITVNSEVDNGTSFTITLPKSEKS